MYAARILIGAAIEWACGVERWMNKRLGPWLSPKRYD